MKNTKLLIALLVFVFITLISFTVSAVDMGLTTEALSDDKKSDIMDRVDIKTIRSHTPLVVRCFDVNGDHMLLIGSDDGDNAVVAVYDEHGSFQYGFKIEEFGSFRVMWSGDNIAYYSIRSRLILEINKDGELVDISCAEITSENSVHDQKVLSSTTRTVGDDTYRMTNGSRVADFSNSFKLITRSNADGTEVIYDASGNRTELTIRRVVFIVIVLGVFITGFVRSIKNQWGKK